MIICVPTPLNKNREPDISYILETGRAIAPHLHRGILVVLESTTYPGTTDEDLRAVLETGSGLEAGADFHLAFSFKTYVLIAALPASILLALWFYRFTVPPVARPLKIILISLRSLVILLTFSLLGEPLL